MKEAKTQEKERARCQPGSQTANPRPCRPCGFTLVELLVVAVVLSILMALLLPTFSRAKESARGAACLSNLRQIGIGLQLYIQENENKLPIMRDYFGGTTNLDNQLPAVDDPEETRTDALPRPEVVLQRNVGNTNVFKCPSDQKLFFSTGSSYSWNSALNGQDAEHLNLMGTAFDPHQIPVFLDKEKFHAARGENKGQNFLYADGHMKNLLVLDGVLPEKR